MSELNAASAFMNLPVGFSAIDQVITNGWCYETGWLECHHIEPGVPAEAWDRTDHTVGMPFLPEKPK